MQVRSYQSLRVLDVVAETQDAKSLVLDVPADLESAFRYAPGQFLTFRIPSAAIMRCYSMASSPHAGEPLKVTIKRVAGGIGSNWLCDHVKPGDFVEVLPPAGIFTPASLANDLLLLAGGSGITPIISVLKSALAEGGGRILLVYANRDEASIIFRDELRLLVQRYPARLTVVHWLDTLLSLPTSHHLRRLIEGWAGAECFICGPGPFMDSAAAAVLALGTNADRVHIERFVVEDEVPADAGGQASVVEVVADGRTQTLSWPRNMRLLDVLLNAKIRAPYSCRMGACCACAWRMLEGKVELLHNDVLNAADLAEGWILTCQAIPLSPTIKISAD
jgi:3-ketosteroid 9alpha-monooxygenase subunit B